LAVAIRDTIHYITRKIAQCAYAIALGIGAGKDG
jgi:hypothetical protein